MDYSISDDLLSKFSEFVTTRIGLHFPTERWHELDGKIGFAAQEFGFEDKAALIQHLMTHPLTQRQIEILASHLTVGETYFMREKRALEILDTHLLPELIRARRGTDQYLRIWSAGCCTGEEPYSLAISISQAIADLKDWKITLLATDINPQFLRKASAGVYGEWSFRGTPLWVRQKYFRPSAATKRFEILPTIKAMVTFCCLNLVEDPYPSVLNNGNAMDITFCRNVLMYFARDQIKQVVQKFYNSLAEGGWLIVSPSEVSQDLFPQFVTVNFPGAILYRKDTQNSLAMTGKKPVYALPDISPAKASFDLVAQAEAKVRSDPGNLMAATAAPSQTPYQVGLTLYRQGQYVQVTKKLEELFAPKEATPEAMVLLARAYANLGQLAAALAWCKKAITANKLDPQSHYLCATILQEQNLVDEAIISLKRTLYLEPDFVLAHFTLGNLALRKQNLREAAKYFDNVLLLLETYQQDDILLASDGITAGTLMDITRSTILREGLA